MPIFNSSSHVQINGGNFIEVGGDYNLQSIQPPTPPDADRVLTGPEFHVGQDLNRSLVGAERSERAGITRMLPYGAFEALSRCIYL
jgi:hypothetical protein